MFKKIIINSIIIFIISSLIHSLYNYLPNFFTAIIVPVNESIWEHMKMIFSSYMLFLLIQWLFYKKKDKNFITGFVLTAIFNIMVFLIIYLPIRSLFGEIMIITLIVYFISILISNYFKYKINEKKNNKTLNKVMGFSIIIIYAIFTILSFYPLKIDLFYDEQAKLYGIYRFYS